MVAYSLQALLWNDHAILESFHSAAVFKVLEDERCNILEAVDEATKNGMRKAIISLILATDMSLHFENISKLKLRRHSEEFDFDSEVEDFWCVCDAGRRNSSFIVTYRIIQTLGKGASWMLC